MNETKKAALLVTIPVKGWHQIGGDMDPGSHGGLIAKGDGRTVDLIEIQPVREYVGDGEAREVGFPYWTRVASFDASDLALDARDVQSAMQCVGLTDAELEDLAPEVRSLAIAEALLRWGRTDEGPAGFSGDIGIPAGVEWWGGVGGAEYLADEDAAFRAKILGESEEDDVREQARKVLDAAGQAGGIDEVRRIAERGWPGDVDGAPASPELLAAIQDRAREILAESEENDSET